jgi:hypothetical protein
MHYYTNDTSTFILPTDVSRCTALNDNCEVVRETDSSRSPLIIFSTYKTVTPSTSPCASHGNNYYLRILEHSTCHPPTLALAEYLTPYPHPNKPTLLLLQFHPHKQLREPHTPKRPMPMHVEVVGWTIQ